MYRFICISMSKFMLCLYYIYLYLSRQCLICILDSSTSMFAITSIYLFNPIQSDLIFFVWWLYPFLASSYLVWSHVILSYLILKLYTHLAYFFFSLSYLSLPVDWSVSLSTFLPQTAYTHTPIYTLFATHRTLWLLHIDYIADNVSSYLLWFIWLVFPKYYYIISQSSLSVFITLSM